MKNTTMALPPHVIVVGHGRSGTNMVLDLFDCHHNSFCRNEPNELRETAFAKLGDAMFGGQPDQEFAQGWVQAVGQSICSNGARDRFNTDKVYFRSGLHARLGQAAMSRARIRRYLVPQKNGQPVEEWTCPGFHYDKTKLAGALPVLKILLAPAWTVQAHKLFSTQRVVHVVRSPDAFLQSWWSRYVTGIGGGPEKVFLDNQPSLVRILEHFDRPAEMPEGYSLRALLVSELWRWRYMNEVVADALSTSDRYLLVPYKGAMAQRLSWTEKLYSFAGLTMTDTVREQVEGMQNTLFKARKSDGLDVELVSAAVAEVMCDSQWRTHFDQ